MLGPLKKLNNRIKSRWESFLSQLPSWSVPWIRDIADVGKTVVIAIIVLKLVFGADMLVPFVVVTSDSMVHEKGDDSWLTWMTQRGISEGEIRSFPMKNGFDMGDMIVVKNPKAGLGDVIIYVRDLDHMHFQSRDPIIHRVVGVVHVRDYQVAGSEGTLDCYDPGDMGPFIEKVINCQQNKGQCPYIRYPKDGDFKFFITKGDHNMGTDQCSRRLNISHPVTDAQVTGRGFLRLPYIGWIKLLLNFILSLPFQLFRILTLTF